LITPRALWWRFIGNGVNQISRYGEVKFKVPAWNFVRSCRNRNFHSCGSNDSQKPRSWIFLSHYTLILTKTRLETITGKRWRHKTRRINHALVRKKTLNVKQLHKETGRLPRYRRAVFSQESRFYAWPRAEFRHRDLRENRVIVEDRKKIQAPSSAIEEILFSDSARPISQQGGFKTSLLSQQRKRRRRTRRFVEILRELTLLWNCFHDRLRLVSFNRISPSQTRSRR